MPMMIGTLLLCALFFLMCYLGTGSDQKNIRHFSSYPDDVQKVVRKNPALSSQIRTPAPSAVFLSNLLLFGVVLFLYGLVLKKETFAQNFLLLVITGEILNLFDLLVIDMLWWRHSPRARFTGTEHMDSAYQDMTKHVNAFIRAIPLFVIVALVDGALLTLL